VLVAAGINSYAAISAASVARLTEIVRDAKMRRPASIETWPEQAALLAADDDQAFKELTDKLKGGRRT